MAKSCLLLLRGEKMVSTRHKARNVLMDEFLETLDDDDKLKKSMSQVWNWEVSDKDDEKMIWDCTRTKLKGVNDELLDNMKNAGSIETEMGSALISDMETDLDAFEEKYGDYLRQRGSYDAYDKDNTFKGEIMHTIKTRLEKAITAGYELPVNGDSDE